MTNLLQDSPHRSWGEAVRAFRHPRVVALLFLGFSAGVPILLVFSTLSVWLREAEVSRAAIGFFSWAALAYGFKVVWAPLIDKVPLPLLTDWLGRRRSWLLVAQVAIVMALAHMAMVDPAHNLYAMAFGAVMLGFASATQDIVIDAYRIEAADEDLQGLMSAAYIAGYRIGMVVAGAGALELAGILDVIEGYDYAAWQVTYQAMAGVMGIGILTTFIISEPEATSEAAAGQASTYAPLHYFRFFAVFLAAAAAFAGVFLATGDGAAAVRGWMADGLGITGRLAGFLVETTRFLTAVGAAVITAVVLVKLRAAPRDLLIEAYVEPFTDFFSRFGRVAVMILVLVATFRIADVVMGVMANVFYVDLGFSKQEIGRITKFFGLLMTLVGGFAGGLLTLRYGVMKTLFVGGVLAAATNILFAVLAGMGPMVWMLMVVIGADNLSAGIASAAFVAYLSGLTSRKFTATQYALFSSMMLLLPKLIAGYSGMVVESVGYATFFIGTAAMGVIPLALIIIVARRMTDATTSSTP